MQKDLISSAIAALQDRDEERLKAEIAARPRELILAYSARAADRNANEEEPRNSALSDAEADSLKAALVSYILHSRGPYLETALSCLGAYRAPALKSFMRDQLRKCLTDPDRFSGALAQCMVALMELGEPIMSGAEFNAGDLNANVNLAENYLMRG